MALFSNKRGLIMGVANSRSIATGIAEALKAEGADIGYSFLPDEKGKMEQRLNKAVDHLNPAFVFPCDVNNDEQIDDFFNNVKKHWEGIDFLVHSIAYADMSEIKCKTLDVSRKGFLTAMESSVYSFIAVAQKAQSILNKDSSILTLSYYGGEKIIPGYNLMGVAKAALESSSRYLAYDLGEKAIRVNAISAGPIKTLAASAIGDFSSMLGMNSTIAPLKRTVTTKEVGSTALYLLSQLSSGVTGELIHVDGGYHAMGAPAKGLRELKATVDNYLK